MFHLSAFFSRITFNRGDAPLWPPDKSMQTTTSPQGPMQKATPPMPPASVDAGAINVRLKTEDLFAGSREIALLHNGREYRLRITQQGKLLLTA
jgi:hemin uptake protein HemP